MKIKGLKGRDVITTLFKHGKVIKAPPLLIRFQKFYESHGFISTGIEYLEDGIPHCEMHRD